MDGTTSLIFLFFQALFFNTFDFLFDIVNDVLSPENFSLDDKRRDTENAKALALSPLVVESRKVAFFTDNFSDLSSVEADLLAALSEDTRAFEVEVLNPAGLVNAVAEFLEFAHITRVVGGYVGVRRSVATVGRVKGNIVFCSEWLMVFLIVLKVFPGFTLLKFFLRRTALPADPFDLDIGVFLDNWRATHGGYIAIGSGKV